MNVAVVIIMVLLGLCFVPFCLSRLYILVPVSETWTDAQTYCRSKYTDLVVVQTEQELAELNQLIGSLYYVWIGLHADIDAWRWSLENHDFYGVGETGFRMWAAGEPSFGFSQYKACVAMLKTGIWSDVLCSSKSTFICYNGTAETQDTSSSFIFVNQAMTWTDAQSYCRTHYTDLASVRNQAENDQMKTMTQNSYTWIGLYRNSWVWSDGSSPSITNWNPGQAPTATTTHTCVVSYFGQWTNLDCTTQAYFACFVVPVRKLLVRMVLKNTDSSVDMEVLTEDVLQKLHQRLQDQILNEDMKLSWVKHPDGKVFYK